MPTELLVHIGYHKTGSTWLQSTLFRDTSLGFVCPWDADESNRRLVKPHDFDFDARDVRREFEAACAAAPQAELPVISNERLSGNPHSGGFDSRQLAERLAAVFPDARVLIVIREQVSMITSVYGQFVRVGGAVPLARYLHPSRPESQRVPGFRFEHFAYDRLITHYQERFGRERVCVALYEQLRADPDAFTARVLEFSGRNPAPALASEALNPGISRLSLTPMRWVNRWLVRDPVNPAAPVDSVTVARAVRRGFEWFDSMLPSPLRRRADSRLRARVAREVADRYVESNRRTAACTDLDLARWSYGI